MYADVEDQADVVHERAEKAHEARLRRLAAKKGWRLQKLRVGKWDTVRYGRWFVIDADMNFLLCGEWGLSLDEVQDWVTEED